MVWAATDYLRLATKLAETASPCADYYVSVPPIVGDKTRPRPGAASRIRALGPNFHAMGEFHFTAWSRWVQETGSTWYAAGVTARERMAAAGYEMAQGDIWVVNELSTAVRRGTGSARANVREMLRGLYEGGGRPTRGAVLIVGVGQRTTDTSLLQTNLQNWYSDSAFWTDMSAYVGDWSQEVYGDIRSHAVPGVPEQTRRDYLNDYLQHPLVLAEAGPPTIETARAYLQGSYIPLANAAWERESGYGWTMVPSEQMAAYVSSQVHAQRYYGATKAWPQDRIGFVWAPRNAGILSPSDFTTRTGLILDRLAAAIRDSAQLTDPADPGSAACGPPGQSPLCAFDVEGARLNEAWKSFRTWTQPALAFASAAQTIAAGAPSAALSLNLTTSSGLPITSPTGLSLALSSSSPTGGFSSSPAGPWTRTLTATISPGSGASTAFYYRDTRAGSHTLTASALGATSGTQTITVTAGPVSALTLQPGTASVRVRASRTFSVAARDAFGNVVPAVPRWSLEPRSLGKLATATNGAATFTAGRTLGAGRVVATSASLRASAELRVTPGRLRITNIAYLSRPRSVVVTVSAQDGARKAVSETSVVAVVFLDGRRYVSKRIRTGPAGRVRFSIKRPRSGCLSTTVRRVAAAGFAWDGRTPRNRSCLG